MFVLQVQFVYKDILIIFDVFEKVLFCRLRVVVFKGWNNYICLYKVWGGLICIKGQDVFVFGVDFVVVVDDGWEVEVVLEFMLGVEVVMLWEWVEKQVEEFGLGDCDDVFVYILFVWIQVSVLVNECFGVQWCLFGSECFLEVVWEQV